VSRKTRLRVLPGGLLLGAAVVLWLVWTKQLAPAEAAVAGSWITPLRPDGSATAILLRRDRTCLARWRNRAGEDTQAPREGRWWVDGGTLFVDTSTAPPWYEFERRRKLVAMAWTFAIHEETLVLTQSRPPLTLRRGDADAPP
jgi:hypothetical protein